MKVACSGATLTADQVKPLADTDTSNARFYYLFDDCSQLIQAPELPAAILVDWCYCAMFDGCTGLTQAPKLPAETLAGMCYRNMFLGCGNLSSVTMLATDVSAFDALFSWLTRTAEGGTLYVASGMEADEKVTGSLPTDKNWKVAVAATN